MFWFSDWMYGVPVLVGTIVLHVSGLILAGWVLAIMDGRRKPPRTIVYFIAAVSTLALIAVTLHGVEAHIWAVLYLWLGALPNYHAALLYSFDAVTSYGHAPILLRDGWQLLGAIEAMNGLILFGLTTAFLLGAIARLRPVHNLLKEQ